MHNRVVLILLIFLLPGLLAAQEGLDESTSRQLTIEQLIESIAEGLEEGQELDYTTLFEDLNYFYDHPLDLNKANYEDLKSIYLLTDIQINAIREHKEKYGPFDSIYELQAVPGFDLVLIYRILPFITVNEKATTTRQSFRTIIKEGRGDLFLRYQEVLEERKGFSQATEDELMENPNSRYLGSAARLYTRFRYSYRNNLSIGITAEKDPGEEFFKGSQKNGFDFYSAHFYYKDRGFVRELALGDFQVQFGQGLALWSGLGFGKSAFAMNVKRSTPGIRPYTSVDENRFMRGAAITLGKGQFEWTNFYSSKKIDANIGNAADTLANDEEVQITSFQLSGFHRTESEIFDKDAIREQHYGSHLSYKGDRLKIGLTGLHTQYDADVQRNLSLYNQFEFNSNRNTVGSIDYTALLRNINFFGEVAMSESGGIASLNGALFAVHKRLSFVAMHRYYERDFQSVLANAFAESTRPVNERGFYLGMNAGIARGWTLSGYFDQFRFPWLRFVTDGPSHGYDGLLQLKYKPSKKSEFYFRYRHRERFRNQTALETVIDFPVEEIQENVRINAAYQVSKSVKFKSRIEWRRYQLAGQEHETGILFYQDVLFRKINSPWALSFRYAIFDTDSYNARIYAYENDLLYAFSIPAYSGRGTRVYAMVKYKIGRRTDLWLRWSQWFYTDRNFISSGLNEIQGNSLSEVKAQLRFRF